MEDAIDNAPTLWEGQVSRQDGGAYQVHNYLRPLKRTSGNQPPNPEGPENSVPGGFDDDSIISWELMIAKQQGRDVLVGAVNVAEIDAVCMVPHLPNLQTVIKDHPTCRLVDESRQRFVRMAKAS